MKVFHLYKIKTDKESDYKLIYAVRALPTTTYFDAVIVRSDIPNIIMPIYSKSFYEIIDLGCPAIYELQQINTNFAFTVKTALIVDSYLLRAVTSNNIIDKIKETIMQSCLCNEPNGRKKYCAMVSMTLCRLKHERCLKDYVEQRVLSSKNL